MRRRGASALLAAVLGLAVAAPASASDRDIAARAAARNVWVWPLSPYFLGTRSFQGLMLGFGNVPAQEIPRAVRVLQEVIYERL